MLAVALVLAAGPLTGTGLYGGFFIDDLALAQRFFDNPAAAESSLFGKRLAVLGRVQSIRGQSAGRLFDVTLAPRSTPASPVVCSVSMATAAKLKRGQLIIAEGRMERDGSLHLRGCRIAYDFQTDEAEIGIACDSCILKSMMAGCAKGIVKSEKCEPSEAQPFASAIHQRMIDGGLAKLPVECDNPLVAFIWDCELNKDDATVSASCSLRSEVIRIRNELAATDDFRTRNEAGRSLWVQKPERSRLLDSMIRSGTLPDEEP